MVSRLLSFIYCLCLTVSGVSAESLTHQVTGANVFLKYCSGCHGLDGFATYEHAPSFSMGERLQKDDRELLQSVLNGKNSMPPWKDKLPVQALRDAISYLRIMHERHTKGEMPLQDELPKTQYLFKPVGEPDMDWIIKKDK